MELQDILDLHVEMNSSDRYTYNGKNVPRVTEVLSKMISEEKLMNWANSLGFKHKRYRDVLNQAATFGTKVHHGIECLLKGLPVPEDTPQVCLNAFKEWWKVIQANNYEIIGQEKKLVCEWYGGTYDCLMKINDKIYLIDFKTSNHVTYKYYLQLAAYSKVLREKEGINIDGVIILQLNKYQPKYKEYILDLSIPDHKNYFDLCERTFISILYSYYHIHYLEENFNDLTKKLHQLQPQSA